MDKRIPIEMVESKIYLIRSHKVMLDHDLAYLYGVETKYLKRQVKRNISRFPVDFMFQLTKEENLRCQNVTSSYGGRRYLPFAFTEQGIAMLSSVLNSERAIQVNIMIMRAFIRLRQVMLDHKELSDLFNKLETRVDQHDNVINEIVEAIRELMMPVRTEAIGFHID
jgi:hypothetical protein